MEEKALAPEAELEPGAGPGIEIDYHYLRQVEADSGVKISACYQCRKCSNGCPVSFAMDLRPEQVIKLVLLGASERVESCHTLWLCSACQTCYTRCPNDVDIPRLMDYLKEQGEKRGLAAPERAIQAFHRAFLADVRMWGRAFEAGMMPRYLMSSGKMNLSEGLKNLSLALGMFKRGRLGLAPRPIKGLADVQALFAAEFGENMMERMRGLLK